MKNLSLIAAAILATTGTVNALNTNRVGIIESNSIALALIPSASPDTTGVMDPHLPSEATPANGLILNFHEVPLNAVLSYLSAKAGLIVVSDVDLRGAVNLLAEQPVSTNEIVELLSAQLARNNYAVTLHGRTLTIMDASLAKTSAFTPVIVNHSAPQQIPINDEVVTEILPLRTLQSAQLINELATLIPAGDTVSANEAANAIIMTASQKDIRRISEIIAALDGSAISEVEVFVLRYADARSVASELTEIFQTADSDTSSINTRNDMGGPGGPGGGMPPGFPGGGGGEGSAKNAQTHAVFVADDQMNAIVASAPPGSMQTISNLIADLDQPTQGITEIRVLRLKHADPGEIVDELSNLFPTSNGGSDQNSQSMGFQFNSPQQPSPGNAGQNTRMTRQSTMMAVADRRTQSVIVTASREMMEQIKKVVQELDRGGQGAQKITALDFGGADPGTVQETMSGLFSSANSSGTSSTTTATPLANRYTGNANSQSTTTSTASTASTTASLGGSSASTTGAH